MSDEPEPTEQDRDDEAATDGDGGAAATTRDHGSTEPGSGIDPTARPDSSDSTEEANADDEGTTAEEEADSEGQEGDDGPEVLRSRVEELEAEIESVEAELAETTEELQEERERANDAEQQLKRKAADFQNYKKRVKERRSERRKRATKDLVERLLDVRDNLVRALDEDNDSAGLRDGLELPLREFDRVLEDENVDEIEPEPGDEVDPSRHEVMLRTESDRPADTIADVYRSGYEMAGQVIREAQVTVSKGDGSEPATDGASDTGGSRGDGDTTRSDPYAEDEDMDGGSDAWAADLGPGDDIPDEDAEGAEEAEEAEED